MRKSILGLMFLVSCFPFLMENSCARNLIEECNEEEHNCLKQCENCYKTPLADVWGMLRTDHDLTLQYKAKCQHSCSASNEDCIKNANKRESEEIEQEKLNKQLQTEQEGTTIEYPQSPSDSKIYKWTDKNGVIHFANDKDSIPTEYRQQVEQGLNKETKATSNKKTESKNMNTQTDEKAVHSN